jgi:hypothetical protein
MTIEDFVPTAASTTTIYCGGNSSYGYRLETLGTSAAVNNQSFAGAFRTVQNMPTSGASLGLTLLIENYTTTNQYKFGTQKAAYQRDTAPTAVMAFDVGVIPFTAAISALTIQSGTATMTIKVYGVN